MRPSRTKEYRQAYYRKNRTRFLSSLKRYREKNPEKFRACKKASYQKRRAHYIRLAAEWKRKNKDKVAASARKRREECLEKSLWRSAKVKAKSNGVRFNIEPEDIKIPTHCPVFGIKFYRGLDKSVSRDKRPSIDRIDNRRGYVRGNVAIISMRANRIKSDSRPEELRALLRYMRKARP